MRFDTLPQWLQYLEKRCPLAVDLRLERILPVARVLEVTHFRCPVITVAGTNGKGSTVAFLEAFYRAEGLAVGSYTSPHLFRFNERIGVDGVAVGDEEICVALAEIDERFTEIPLTYFEMTTLAALLIFKRRVLDILILEVGLGGRLDAVNVVESDVSVITSIGLDHVQYLGYTLSSIAREKAGIIRPFCPVVCGESDPPESLMEVVHSKGAVLYRSQVDFHYEVVDGYLRWRWGGIAIGDLPLPQLYLPNAAQAIMATQCLLHKVPLSPKSIASGLFLANLPGRQQIIKGDVVQMFDVAHNPQAMQCLVDRVKREFGDRRIWVVMGFLADKLIQEMLLILNEIVYSYHVGYLPSARSAAVGDVIDSIGRCGDKSYYGYSTIVAAYQAALAQAKKGDCLLVTGSFHAVAPILEKFGVGERFYAKSVASLEKL